MVTSYTLSDLATKINAKLQGDGNCQINGVTPLDKAQAEKISFLHSASYRRYLNDTKAAAVILNPQDASKYSGNALIVDDPYAAYAKVANLFARTPKLNNGIHSSAVIGKDCHIDPTASIGPQCAIGNGVKIGANSIIHAGCVIGEETEIGSNTMLWARVTIYHGIKIGNNVIIHSGAIIGSDGFGFANEQGKWLKIPQIGGVVIGNDVEIGANTTIDRGAIEDTIIEQGVKIDNLVQIAHNVYIGAHTAIAGCVGIAGSARIGKHCMIGGGASIVGHIEIADNVILIGTAVVEKALTEPGIYASGLGILPFRELKKLAVRFRQLDEMAQRLNKLEKAQATE